MAIFTKDLPMAIFLLNNCLWLFVFYKRIAYGYFSKELPMAIFLLKICLLLYFTKGLPMAIFTKD
jgi:hypothetical protein